MVADLPLARSRIRLPDASRAFTTAEVTDADRNYIRELNAALQRELESRVSVDNAAKEILLLSPDGSVYALGVSNTGTLTTTIKYQST